jgi:acetyl esterase/lipase
MSGIGTPVRYIMVCVSYRGYWTSKGRPSESGIAKDAVAALKWIASQPRDDPTRRVPLILWGQSIGAGVATNLAASHELLPGEVDIKLLILETPFTNIRDMLVTIYPQKWLPYKYLWPFLWNHLDSWRAFEQISLRSSTSLPKVILLEAEKDELVPKSHGDALEKRCIDLGLDVKRYVIGGALHTEVMSRPEGRIIAAENIRAAGSTMGRS